MAGQPTRSSHVAVCFRREKRASWRELSVLAHLFRGTDAAKHRRSSDELPSDWCLRQYIPDAAAGPGSTTKPIGRLTRREHEVLRLLSTGASPEKICLQLGIATSTTRAHVWSILRKLGVHDRLAAVTFGLRTGLLESGSQDGVSATSR